MAGIPIGTLDTGALGVVDAYGRVTRGDHRLRWWIVGIGDEIDPATHVSTRQERPTAAPLVATSVRVPGGDVVARAYGVPEGEGTIVVEFENASGEAVAIAVELEGGATASVLRASKVPGDTPGNRIVFPVPHRTKLRVAWNLVGAAVEIASLASPDAVERAWDAMLDTGARVELSEPLQSEVDAARADVLLAAPSADAFVALEDWGFDEHARAMWMHLRWRDRRRARRRAVDTGVLGEIRAALVDDRGDEIAMLPGFRNVWLGQPVAVHEMPTRRGRCSFAVRWHGARPALLWDVPAGTTLRAPVLDPSWSTSEPVGETLLSEPDVQLLSMGTKAADRAGAPMSAPESFS